MNPDLIPKLAYMLVLILSAWNLNKLRWCVGKFQMDKIASCALSIGWWIIGTMSMMVICTYPSFSREDEFLSVSLLILCLLYNVVEIFAEKLVLIDMQINISKAPWSKS